MKTVRISKIIWNRVWCRLSIILCGFGLGVCVTHAAVCAVSWDPLHGLIAVLALLYAALELLTVRGCPSRRNSRREAGVQKASVQMTV